MFPDQSYVQGLLLQRREWKAGFQIEEGLIPDFISRIGFALLLLLSGYFSGCSNSIVKTGHPAGLVDNQLFLRLMQDLNVIEFQQLVLNVSCIHLGLSRSGRHRFAPFRTAFLLGKTMSSFQYFTCDQIMIGGHG